jgi:hypothetical protein
MKTIVLKYVTISALVILGFGGYCQADTDTKEELPLLKLKVMESNGSSNLELKTGEGCEDLEEVKGETFQEIPLAQTISCDEVDCKDLEAAKLQDHVYKDLPNAKTTAGCEE